MDPATPPNPPSTRERILSPVERTSEVVFGLIMALSFTGSISIAESSRQDLRTMLIGAIGCNTAWGIVDAIMYLLTLKVERRRGLFLLNQVRGGADPERGRRIIADALPPLIAQRVRPEELEHVRLELAAMPQAPSARLTSRDLLGALGIFLLVFLSTFPIAVPFLFPLEPVRALRISNAVALVMLFFVGYALGGHARSRPWAMGAAMMAIGGALVAVTIALGG